MELEDFDYVVIKGGKTFALFVSADDAIKFAETKKDKYSWVEVWKITANQRIFYWIY